MTDLPIARSGAAQPPKVGHVTITNSMLSLALTIKPQGNVTRFSLKARPEQGDASGWTAIPGQEGPLALQAAVRTVVRCVHGACVSFAHATCSLY